MNLFLMRLGRPKASAMITFASVFFSIVLTTWLHALFDTALTFENTLPAIIAPLLIAAPISWYILGMLFYIHQLEQKMRILAMRDPLTNLYNRRFFYEYMEKWVCIAGRVEKPFSVVLLDIDHFKNVNDQYGHEAGDVVIQHVANILQTNLRKSDVICRFGGEEYAVGLIGVEQETAKVIMEKIRELLTTTIIPYQEKELSVTVSIGVTHRSDGKNVLLENMIHEADRALYHAKNSGRNRVCTQAFN